VGGVRGEQLAAQGAVACSPMAAAAGATAGTAATAAGGAVAGGVVGGQIGAAIDKGIALFNEARRGDGSRDGCVSGHGQDRMGERGVSPDQVQQARDFGRVKPGNTPETVVREVPSAASASGKGIEGCH